MIVERLKESTESNEEIMIAKIAHAPKETGRSY
jgi:hypothetical protein